MASTLTELADSFKHQWNDEGSTFQYTEKECDVEKAKEKAEEFKVLGNTYFKQNRFDDAATAYTKAIECCERLDEPGMVDSLHVYFCNRALTALKLENYGLTIVDADRALEYNSKSIKAFYRRGTAYAALGKLPQALRDFKSCYSLSPDKNIYEKVKECTKEINRMKFAKAISFTDSNHEFSANIVTSESGKPLWETIQLDTISNESTNAAKQPVFRKEPEFLQELIQFIRVQGNVLNKRDAYRIVLEMIVLLKKEPTLIDITLTGSEGITICGDIHGQFYDLLNILEINGLPSENNSYLFNGDFVDRGSFSVECVLTLFLSKLLFPNNVFLTRGNHETRNMNKLYGFQGEVLAKYDAPLYELFCECFCYLPLAHLINKKVFVVHGGLFSKDNVTLEDIAALDRNAEPPEEGVMTEILWSDPQDTPGRSISKRGVACAFGPDVTEAFLKKNDLLYVIRSHEMKQNGYDCQHDKKMITVFSAPNYCDQMGNKGAFIKITGDDLTPKFTTFDAVPHPSVLPMQYANPILSLFG